MTVQAKDEGIIELADRCEAEDAEILQRLLLAAPRSSVEWRRCSYLHTAVVQVLLARKPNMQGAPEDAFLAKHIAPLLDRSAK